MPDGPMCNPALHVLVAEDEASVALVIDENLTECGFRVTCAPDGAVAVAELSAHPFDAVVTDIRMPNLDGVSLVRSILATFPRMPIVVLSGYMTAQQRGELLALGVPAEALLEKPSGFRDLRGTLIRLLSATHP
ncbi:MAG TPA: response regulator [Roseomonas sp.]|jgi:CheY-like chemotaxis protein